MKSEIFEMFKIITLKQEKFSQSDPVLIRQISKKFQSDPVLIRPKLASVLNQSDPVLIRAHLCCIHVLFKSFSPKLHIANATNPGTSLHFTQLHTTSNAPEA